MLSMQTTPEQLISVRELSRQLEKYDANESINALLKRPEFQSLLSHIFNALSPESKAATRKWLQPPESSSGPTNERSPAALAILCAINSVSLPEEVQELFSNCMHNPRSFWDTFEFQTPLISESAVLVLIVASNIYLRIRRLRLRRKWDTIVWRYYALFFYDLALLIGNGQIRITKKLLGGLFHVLKTSRSITDDAEAIEANLLAWCAAGHRYWKLCDALDDGALFLLPQSDDIWENENLLPGSSFNKAINRLSEIGICKTSRAIQADTLGTNVRSCILEPFRWNVSVFKMASPRKKEGKTGKTAKVGKKGPGRKTSLTTASQNSLKETGGTPESQTQRLDLLFRAALYSDRQTASALSAENQRNVECEVPANFDANGDNQLNPSQTASITARALLEQTRAFDAQATHRVAFDNESLSNPNNTSQYGGDLNASLQSFLRAGSQPSLGQEDVFLPQDRGEGWGISEEFMQGRPTTGQEEVFPQGQGEGWGISEEFMQGSEGLIQSQPLSEQGEEGHQVDFTSHVLPGT